MSINHYYTSEPHKIYDMEIQKAKHLCFGVIEIRVLFICDYFFQKIIKNIELYRRVLQLSSKTRKNIPKNCAPFFQLIIKLNLRYI